MNSRKHFFNMVEVALALLVISLGLSTVLTLFPAGLKATAKAENANNVVEAAEYIFAYLQTLANETNGWDSIKTTDDNNTSPIDDGTNSSRIEKLEDGVYVYRKLGATTEFSCIVRILEARYGMESASADHSYLIPTPLTRQQYEDNAGNSARIQCGDYYFLLSENNSHLRIVNVELSYPGNLEYDKREKRTFRVVLLRSANSAN